MVFAHQTLIAELEAALLIANASSFSAAAEQCVEAGVSPVKLVEMAIKARNKGMAESSEAMLRKLIDKLGDAPKAVYVELAFQQRKKGNFAEAVTLLRQANATGAPDFRTSLSAAHMLYANGNHEEAETLLTGLIPAGERELREMEAMLQFGRYLREFPLPRVLEMLDELKARNKWMQQKGYGPFVVKASQKGTPFSLIRLGDGEGACIKLDAGDEEAFGALYELNRQNRISVWFGADFNWRTNGFMQSCAELPRAIEEADLLAIPDSGWLKHAYQISSTTGIPSLVNIIRLLLARDPGLPKLRLCTHAAHVELYQHGYIETIIRAAKDVSVVTCLPDLPAELKAGFDLDSVSLFQIPGEHGARKALGEGVDFGNHYPTAFQRLTAELSVPHNGKLFLIAGGFLGKLYAATIRRHGGVALDIGSLVDSWMGRKTRPGDDSALRLGAAQVQAVSEQTVLADTGITSTHASEAASPRSAEMPLPYVINTLPSQFVDHQGLQSLYDHCVKPGQRVALVGFNESAKHLVNLCGENIVCFYDPAEWKHGISFRGKKVLGAQEKHDITHIAVCDLLLAYDFAGEIATLYGGAIPVFVPARLNQQATGKIEPFKQERIYKDIFAHSAEAPISMLGHEKICFLMEMLRYALRLPGDVVEFGVWQGGAAWYMAKILAFYGDERKLFLADLFETLTNNRNATMCNDEIARSLKFYPNVEMMVGLVTDPKIIARLAERKFCFAHYDLGFHPSTLQNLWERLLPGAPLILDNYGHLAAAPLKFEQFFAERDARVIRLPWSDHGFVIKGA